MKIAINVDACRGCRMCELVCSFHHNGFFSPEMSFIKISRNNRTSEIGISIDNACDYCQGEEQPQCIKSCCFGALEEVR